MSCARLWLSVAQAASECYRISHVVVFPSVLLHRSAALCTVCQRKQLESIQNGGTVLPIANQMADSEWGSPVSYSSFLVTIRLSRIVSEIFTCDTQDGQADERMDNVDHYYSWPTHCGRPANDCLTIWQPINSKWTRVVFRITSRGAAL